MRGTLVGRDAVLELAVSTLGTAGRVLIEGPAGIGKTALLTALVGQAQERGTIVLRCAPTETEAALPLAALADLLQPLVGDLDSLPAPQLCAARSALLLQHDSAPVDERALAAAVRSLLDTVADRSSTGLLVAIFEGINELWIAFSGNHGRRRRNKRAGGIASLDGITAPVGLCPYLWGIGAVQGPGKPRTVPHLIGCVLPNGSAAVFPGNSDTCHRLDLSVAESG